MFGMVFRSERLVLISFFMVFMPRSSTCTELHILIIINIKRYCFPANPVSSCQILSFARGNPNECSRDCCLWCDILRFKGILLFFTVGGINESQFVVLSATGHSKQQDLTLSFTTTIHVITAKV